MVAALSLQSLQTCAEERPAGIILVFTSIHVAFCTPTQLLDSGCWIILHQILRLFSLKYFKIT